MEYILGIHILAFDSCLQQVNVATAYGHYSRLLEVYRSSQDKVCIWNSPSLRPYYLKQAPQFKDTVMHSDKE